MIGLDILDAGRISGPTACRVIGRQSTSTLNRNRLGGYVGVGRVGSGRRLHLTMRQTTSLYVVSELLERQARGLTGPSARTVAGVLMEGDPWGDLLLVSDRNLMTDDPSTVVTEVRDHGPVTVIPLFRYLMRVAAKLS